MNLKNIFRFLIFAHFALQVSCGGGGGGGGTSFSDILPVDSGTTACTISSKSPNATTAKMPATGSIATNFSVTSSGNDCTITYKLNGVLVSSTGSIAAILPTQLQTGSNTLVVTVTNSAGSASHTWTITRNNPPTCSTQTPAATGNNINVGVPITLIAFSVDTDNDPLSFAWLANSGTANPSYFSITSGANSTQAIFTPNSGYSGANTIAATISDGYDTTNCSWTVTVNSNCSITSSTPGVSTTKVSGIGGTSTAFGVVPNDSACAVTWALNTVNVGTGPFLNILSSSLTAGANTLVATASNGTTSATRSWTVTKNSIPTCFAQSPVATGISIPVATARTISGVMTDLDSDSLSFSWKFNSNASSAFTSITSLTDRSSAIFTPTLAQVGNGQSVQLQVSDGTDVGACSWAFDIADPNTLSISSCTPDTGTTSVVKSVGPAVDYTVVAAGSGLTYVWKKDGNVVGGQTGATYNVTAASLTVGTYTVRVDVTDAYSNTGSCQWTVKRNTPPVLSNITPDNSRSGIADHRMNYASTVALAISGTDGNSDALTYEWSLSPTPNTSLLPNVSTYANTFSPTSGYLGSHAITVRAFDGSEYSDSVVWDVEVNGYSNTCNTILTGKPNSGASGAVTVTGGKICTLVGSPNVGDGVYPDSGDGLKMRMQVTGILDDGSGNLFMTDELNSTVWFWNRSGSPITRLGKTIAAGQIVVLLGNGLIGRNDENLTNNQYPAASPSSQFKLNYPRGGVAWDSTNGRLWVSDYTNSRIVELNSSGAASTVFGSDPGPPIVAPANNTAGNTDDTLGKYHFCANPVGLWFDSANEWLYMSCFGSNSIKKMKTTPGANYTKGYTVIGGLSGTNFSYTGCMTPSTNCVTSAITVDGSPGYTGNAKTNGPWDIKGDSQGNIYWVEYTGRTLRMLNNTGSTINFFNSATFDGTSTISVTDTSATSPITGSSLAVTISDGAGADNKVSITGATSFASGSCAPYNIQIQNASNAVKTVSGNKTINLSATAGTYHTDSGCSSGAVVVATILSGTTFTTIYYKTTASATLTAASSGLTSGTKSVVIGAAGANTKIAVLGANAMLKSDCQPYLVQTLDASNRIANTATTRLFALSDSNGPGTFYSDAGCTTPISSVTISSGTSQASFYYASKVQVPAGQAATLAGDFLDTNANINGTIGNMTFRQPRGLSLFTDAGSNILGFMVSTYDGLGVTLLNNTSGTLNIGAMSVLTGQGQYILGTGAGSYNFDNATGNTMQLFNPHGVTVTADRSKMLVADYSNFRVRSLDLTSGIGDTLINQGRQRAGFVAGATYAPDVYMNAPSAMFFDSSNRKMYFSDTSNGRIRSLDMLKGTVATEIGIGVGNGNTEDQPPQSISLRSPRGVVLLNDHLVYADQQANTGASQSCQIRAWNKGASTSSFFNINIFADTVATIAGNYSLGCQSWVTATASVSGGVATATKFYNPEGLSTDGTNLYFTAYNDHCIIKLKPDGTYWEHVGKCGTAGNVDGTTSSQTARLNLPTLIVPDPVYASDGNMFIVDQTTAGTSAIKYVNFRTNAMYGDGSVSVAGTTVQPATTGNGYVQTLLTATGTPRFNGVAVKDTQICYSAGHPTSGAAGAHNIICVDRTSGFQTLRIGPNDAVSLHKGGASLNSEQEGLSTSTAPDSNHIRLAAPYGLAFDAEGNLYIAERLSHTIRMVRKWW